MKAILKSDVYPPEPWTKQEPLFRVGQEVEVVPAINLPIGHEIEYWICAADPRTGRHNPYGFGVAGDDIRLIPS